MANEGKLINGNQVKGIKEQTEIHLETGSTEKEKTEHKPDTSKSNANIFH